VRGAGVGIGLEDGGVGDDVGHGALILNDCEERESFVGEPVLGQSVEHLDGVVGEALFPHPVEDLLKVGGVGRLGNGGLLAEGVVVGGRQFILLCRGRGWM